MTEGSVGQAPASAAQSKHSVPGGGGPSASAEMPASKPSPVVGGRAAGRRRPPVPVVERVPEAVVVAPRVPPFVLHAAWAVASEAAPRTASRRDASCEEKDGERRDGGRPMVITITRRGVTPKR